MINYVRVVARVKGEGSGGWGARPLDPSAAPQELPRVIGTNIPSAWVCYVNAPAFS